MYLSKSEKWGCALFRGKLEVELGPWTDRHTDRHSQAQGQTDTDPRDHNTFRVVYDSREM